MFNQNTTGGYAGACECTGSLTKAGTGTVVLTGANTHSGGTTVSGGLLVGTTTSLRGNILNNASVTFDQAIAGTYAGVMSGTASLEAGHRHADAVGSNTVQHDDHRRRNPRAGAAGVFSPTTQMFVGVGATFDLELFDQTIGSLGGKRQRDARHRDVDCRREQHEPTVSGVIGGSGSLVKTGTGVDAAGRQYILRWHERVRRHWPAYTGSLQGNILNNAVVPFDQPRAAPTRAR